MADPGDFPSEPFPGDPSSLSPVDRSALRGGARAVGALLEAAGAASELLDRADAVQQFVDDVARDAQRAAEAVDHQAKAARKAVAAADRQLRRKSAYLRGVDALERMGFRRAEQPGVAYQLQYAIRSPKPIPLGTTGLAISLTTQFAIKAEFLPGPAVDKLTLRYDGPTRTLKQFELELRNNLFGGYDIFGLIEVVSVKPKVTADVPPGPAAKPGQPAGAIKLGLEATFRFPRIINEASGKPHEIKSYVGPKIDAAKLLDATHWTEWAALSIDVLPFSIPIDKIGFGKALAERVGGTWTVQLKCFIDITATIAGWLRFCDVMRRVLALGAVVTYHGATVAADFISYWALAFASAPVIQLAALGLAATSAAFAVAAAGRLAIGHALRGGRDNAIALSYCTGYATELEQAIGMMPDKLIARLEQYRHYDFKAALAEISAVVHGREPGAYYVLRPGLTSRDVEAAYALNRAAQDLGRAGALAGIIAYLRKHHYDDSPIGAQSAMMAWGEVVRMQRDPALQGELRRAGYGSLKQRYIALLTPQVAGGDVLEIGFDLENLHKIARPR